MKIIPNKKTLVIIIVALIAVAGGAIYASTRTPSTDVSVKILSRTPSVCTMDEPSSNCGPIKVRVESRTGQIATLTVAGYGGEQKGTREQYDDLSKKLEEAESNKEFVTLKLLKKTEIVGVE